MADVINLPGSEPEQNATLLSGGSIMAQLQFDLATIKDDLGITGTENDAWLERRIAGVWARFETFTSRMLSVPPSQFVDDWGEVASAYGGPNAPPLIAFPRLGSPFLRCVPVVSIDAVETNGQAGDAAAIRFEKSSGKLFTLNSPGQSAHDVSRELVAGSAKITYTAGWETIPADLYEALIGCLSVLWAQRNAQQAGGGAGNVTSINVVDVGTVEMSNAGGAFVEASTRGVRINDPLLGPWTYLLEPYIDFRAQMGSPLIPTTLYLPPTP